MESTARRRKILISGDVVMSSVAPDELSMLLASLRLSFKVFKLEFNGYHATLSAHSAVFFHPACGKAPHPSSVT